METTSVNPAAPNVAKVQLVPKRDDTQTHYADEEEDRMIVEDFCAGLYVQIEVTDVVRGHLTPDGEKGTLVLMTNRFNGLTGGRRLREVEMIINFYDAAGTALYNPDVVKLWPDGEYIYRESEVHVDETTSVTGGAGAGAGYAGASLNANISATWERKTSTTQKGRARMTGVTWRGPASKIRNGIRLFIQENAEQKDGIVSEVHTSVLLRHRDPDRGLKADVQINVNADLWFKTAWRLHGFGGWRAIEAPAFLPRMTARASQIQIQTKALQDADLGTLSGVPAQKKIENV